MELPDVLYGHFEKANFGALPGLPCSVHVLCNSFTVDVQSSALSVHTWRRRGTEWLLSWIDDCSRAILNVSNPEADGRFYHKMIEAAIHFTTEGGMRELVAYVICSENHAKGTPRGHGLVWVLIGEPDRLRNVLESEELTGRIIEHNLHTSANWTIYRTSPDNTIYISSCHHMLNGHQTTLSIDWTRVFIPFYPLFRNTNIQQPGEFVEGFMC